MARLADARSRGSATRFISGLCRGFRNVKLYRTSAVGYRIADARLRASAPPDRKISLTNLAGSQCITHFRSKPNSTASDVATIDSNFCTGDVTRLVACKIKDEVCALLRRTLSLHRYGATGRLSMTRCSLAEKTGVFNYPRMNGIHSNVPFGKFDRCHLRQAAYSPFARAIGCVVVCGHSGRRRDIYDRTTPPAFH